MRVKKNLIEAVRDEYSDNSVFATYSGISLLMDKQLVENMIDALKEMMDADIMEYHIRDGRQIRFIFDFDLCVNYIRNENAIEKIIEQRIAKCKRLRKEIYNRYPEEFDFRFISGITNYSAFFSTDVEDVVYGIFIYKIVEPDDVTARDVVEDNLKGMEIFEGSTIEQIYSNPSIDPNKVEIRMRDGEKTKTPKPKSDFRWKKEKKEKKADPMDDIMDNIIKKSAHNAVREHNAILQHKVRQLLASVKD